MVHAEIRAIAYHLPDLKVTNEDLSALNPDWQMDKVSDKTGIHTRHVAAEDETASDLAAAAAEKLFADHPGLREDVDFLIFCSQTPDYLLPTTACILQDRLGLSDCVGAIDLNLGCSGFVYSASLAKALVESRQCKNVLVLTADTYTKLIHPGDRSVRSVFGDGAAATVIGAGGSAVSLHAADFGSDGRGAANLIVPAGGARQPVATNVETVDASGNRRSDANLFMNGREILMFTLQRIPASVHKATSLAGWSTSDIDLLFLHQASKLVIDTLTRRLDVSPERSWNGLADIGNTVSSTIPIALKQAYDAGALKPGMKIMLSGFGVGYSWGSMGLIWSDGFMG